MKFDEYTKRATIYVFSALFGIAFLVLMGVLVSWFFWIIYGIFMGSVFTILIIVIINMIADALRERLVN